MMMVQYEIGIIRRVKSQRFSKHEKKDGNSQRLEIPRTNMVENKNISL